MYLMLAGCQASCKLWKSKNEHKSPPPNWFRPVRKKNPANRQRGKCCNREIRKETSLTPGGARVGE